MAALGERFMPPRNTLVGEQSPKAFGSTDMGIVSYEVPGLHSAFVVPTPSNVARDNPNFAAAAATDEAHSITIKSCQGLGNVGF
ncbi:aminoacylase 1-like 2 [Fusarium oxysporum f. sp. phaseoli]